MRSSYESTLLRSRTVIKVLSTFLILINLVAPMYKPYEFLNGKFYILTMIACYVYGLLGALGYSRSSMPPLIPIVLIRFLQAIKGFFFASGYSINAVVFILFVLFDFFFVVILIYFHSSYVYMEVDEFEED